MANENNLGVSPKALEAMKTVLEDGNRYPESSCKMLREKLAARYGLKAEQILIGNGLDGVFTMFSRAFMEKGDEVVSGELTFSIYADNAQIMGATPVPVPMKDDLSFDVDGFIRAVTERTKNTETRRMPSAIAVSDPSMPWSGAEARRSVDTLKFNQLSSGSWTEARRR